MSNIISNILKKNVFNIDLNVTFEGEGGINHVKMTYFEKISGKSFVTCITFLKNTKMNIFMDYNKIQNMLVMHKAP